MSVVGIVGDREVSENDFKLIEDAIKYSGLKITKVVSGGAKGADTLAAKWAKKNKIKLQEHKPEWDNLEAEGAVVRTNSYGKQYNARAGFDRNQTIVDDSDAIIALQPNGRSDGTGDTIERAKKRGIAVFIYPPTKDVEHSYEF
jgi:predicted Rossmann fold nucleotide-binding protein DprA/Smf involved in DNA uptake